MKQLKIILSAHAWMKCFIHEETDEIKKSGGWPAILILPGGGFRFCSEREGEPVAAAFYARGYSAFVLDYTTVTKKPDATIDDPMNNAAAALEWIRANGKSNCIDIDRIAMIGFSGGAHLAAAVATHQPLKPTALLLGYPGILHSELRALECPDIVEKVDANTPQTFIFSTADDTVTPPKHAMAFAKALNDAGVEFEMHIFRSGPHGLSLADETTACGHDMMINPRFAKWFDLCTGWLDEVLEA